LELKLAESGERNLNKSTSLKRVGLMIAEEEDSLLHNMYVLQPSPKFKRDLAAERERERESYKSRK
jgi:hypothetical protein